jgi:hypothetical protein
MTHEDIVTLSGQLADASLEDHDALLATGKGPDLQRLVVRTVAQVAAIRAMEMGTVIGQGKG